MLVWWEAEEEEEEERDAAFGAESDGAWANQMVVKGRAAE